jgi:hypothetical protein
LIRLANRAEICQYAVSLRALFVFMGVVAFVAANIHARRQDEMARLRAQIDQLRKDQRSGSYPFDFQPEIDRLPERLKELRGQ